MSYVAIFNSGKAVKRQVNSMKHSALAAIAIFLLAALLASLLPTSVLAQPTTSKTLTSTGTIVQKANYITVNPTTTIATNNLSVGFALDHHWNIWLNTPEYPQLAKNASFKMISLYDSALDSDVSLQPCIYWNELTHSGIFNWTKVDALVRSFLEIGAQPLICLGGTYGEPTVHFPVGMYIDPVTSLPSSEDYANYAVAWVEHFKEVNLPVTYYEIFNEIEWLYYPYNTYFNEGELATFFQVYMAVYNGMHAANDQVMVGNDASTYRNFLDYWVANDGKLDFLAFHKYDCDYDKPETTGLARVESHFLMSDDTYYGISDARKVFGKEIPIICSEYGWDAAWETGTDPRNQQMVSAVALALTLRQEALLNMQYNLYYAWDSSASWQSQQGTGFGFGMINQDNNQPWYPYYVNQFVGQNLAVGDRIIGSTSTSENIRTLAWIHGEKVFTLIICTVNSPLTISFGQYANSGNYSMIDTTYPYTAPQLQIGNLSSNNQLVINGYAVILLES